MRGHFGHFLPNNSSTKVIKWPTTHQTQWSERAKLFNHFLMAYKRKVRKQSSTADHWVKSPPQPRASKCQQDRLTHRGRTPGHGRKIQGQFNRQRKKPASKFGTESRRRNSAAFLLVTSRIEGSLLRHVTAPFTFARKEEPSGKVSRKI